MKVRFLAIHPLLGRANKPAPLHLQQRSPYYWWWAYLRRNQDYLDCCEKSGEGPLAGLYADFGDVRSDSFRAWWGGKLQRGAMLFGEDRIPTRLTRLNSKDDWLDQWEPSEIAVLAVNLTIGKRKLQGYFANFLRETSQRKQGRPALAKVKSTSKYPLHRNTDQHNLRVMLEVYDAWTANLTLPKSQRETMWMIGERLKVVPSAMPKKGDTPKDRADRQNVMANAVSRYHARARKIIANTAEGRFPVG